VLSAEAKARHAAMAKANPAARALVAEMRQRLVDLFAELGAASNQLGKTYPYVQVMRPDTASFVNEIKRVVDPAGRMNPGALGFD
jgi:FAD/FMN-containing dehydrogenase